jgi:hypothetical protein
MRGRAPGALRGRAFFRHGGDHKRRPGAGRRRRREFDMRVIQTSCVASYAQEKIHGERKILKSALPETARGGEGLLVVDDLADTGVTVKLSARSCPRRMLQRSMPSRWGGPSWIPSLPRFRKIPGSIFPETSA